MFICENWDRLFERWRGIPLPDDYLIIDQETTGLNVNIDVPWEIGLLHVHKRQIMKESYYLFNWLHHPLITQEWFETSLRNVKDAFLRRGRTHQVDVDRIYNEGVDPVVGLRDVLKVVRDWDLNGGWFAGHNIAAYDAPLLEGLAAAMYACEWTFPADRLIDTGCLEKARQSINCADPRNQLRPRERESLSRFFRRVHAARLPGILWNIEECGRRYRLCEDQGLCDDQLHGALVDGRAVHLIIEIHKELHRAGRR